MIRATGGEVATTYPVSTTIAICSVKVARSQKPPPKVSATVTGAGAVGHRGHRHEHHAGEGEDVGVGEPLLGPCRAALGEAREAALVLPVSEIVDMAHERIRRSPALGPGGWPGRAAGLVGGGLLPADPPPAERPVVTAPRRVTLAA